MAGSTGGSAPGRAGRAEGAGGLEPALRCGSGGWADTAGSSRNRRWDRRRDGAGCGLALRGLGCVGPLRTRLGARNLAGPDHGCEWSFGAPSLRAAAARAFRHVMAVRTRPTWENACGKLPTSLPRPRRTPRTAGRGRCQDPEQALEHPPASSCGPAGRRSSASQKSRRGTSPRSRAGRRRLAGEVAMDEAVVAGVRVPRAPRRSPGHADRPPAGSRPAASSAGWRRACFAAVGLNEGC